MKKQLSNCYFIGYSKKAVNYCSFFINVKKIKESLFFVNGFSGLNKNIVVKHNILVISYKNYKN